jgi:hypothetical protein
MHCTVSRTGSAKGCMGLRPGPLWAEAGVRPRRMPALERQADDGFRGVDHVVAVEAPQPVIAVAAVQGVIARVR